MPRGKKGKKKTVRRRRRSVGAMSLNVKSPLMTFGPMVAGFFLGDTINNAIDNALPDTKVSQTVKGIAEGGIGGALVFMKLGPRKTPVELIAGGVMLGAGVRRMLKVAGVIQGIGSYGAVPVIAARRSHHRMNGYGAVPVIGNGYTPNRNLAGSLNGVGGYNVPPVPSGVMAGVNVGSGGSECMQ